MGEKNPLKLIPETLRHQNAQQETKAGTAEQTTALLPEEVPSAEQPVEETSPRESAPEAETKKPPPPPPVTRGNLTVNAIPWAEIYVDGKHYGTTPKTIKALKTGRYKVRLENPNFEVWTTRVRIAEGKTAKVSHRFVGFGKIIVNAVPWGNVYLDGSLKGQTPITIQRVSANPHEIRISREGFHDVRRQVTVEAGESESISVKLQRKGS